MLRSAPCDNVSVDRHSLVELGVDKNTTVVFPSPIMTTIAELSAFVAGERNASHRGSSSPSS